MNADLLDMGANIVAVVGILVCAVVGVARLLGNYYFLGYEAMTLFTGGMGLMLFAALVKLHLLTAHFMRKS
jgi:hypothetical protein